MPKARKGAEPAFFKAEKKAPAVAALGPLARIFGVRHLSPMGAFHLRRFLEEVNPTAVLVEGPSDASENIPYLVHKETKPPIALLSFTKARPVRSILFPLAEYSPEWVALTWALKKKRLARFIDLPAATFLALEREEPASAETREREKENDTHAYLDDPYEAIAKLTGEPDHDTWWEKNFEHTTSEDAYRQAIFEFGAGLRELDHESPRRREETLLREAFMRRAIRDVIAEGHDPTRVVVVCGAFHAPVLSAEALVMSDEELAKLPRVEITQTLMPYSYYRLSAQSGYGAGNAAPGYFQALWEELQSGSTERLASRYLSEVAAKFRKGGQIRSSAEVIEAVRLARAMAAVRGDATAPTLLDLGDAAVTCLGHGDRELTGRWIAEVAIGDALGKVPKGILRTALQDDFYRWIKDLRLEDYLKDKAQLIKGSTNKEWLDLREDRFAKSRDAAFRDRNRSIFLHRAAMLGIDFAKNQTTEQDRAESTYKEIWKARWTPECEIRLVENALRGDTIEIAAIRRFQERLHEAKTVGEAAELARHAVECDLPDAMGMALAKVQALAVDDADFVGLAAAAVELLHLSAYKDVRDFDPAPLRPLVAQLFLRAVLMAPEAARCAESHAPSVGKAMAHIESVAIVDEGAYGLDKERWRRTLDAIADDELANAHVAGVACALLLERGLMSDEVLDRRVAKRISPGASPGEGAGFFEGLATRNRYALLAKKSLWAAMSAFIESLDDEAFRRAVVALRRAFASFEMGEARRIAEVLAEIWGGGGKELLAAIETKIDDSELDALQRELEGIEDLEL